MKIGTFVVVVCVALCAGTLCAQTPATVPALSGTWKGELSRSRTDYLPLVMDLKFDGAGITGTVTQPSAATVRAGTYDTVTGVLKLEVAVGSEPGPVYFEGTLVRNTATGKITTSSINGTFMLAFTGAEAAPAGQTSGEFLKKGFDEVAGWVAKAAETVPADKYTYKPVGTVRTFGQLIAHLVDSYKYYCDLGAGRNVQWSDAAEKGATDKATLATKLRSAQAACVTVHATSAASPHLLRNFGHTNLHYGNIVTYMRMMGLVPPSS